MCYVIFYIYIYAVHVYICVHFAMFQLALPDQTEEIYYLTFSPVEDLFYRRLYHKCAEEIRRVGFISYCGRHDTCTPEMLQTCDPIHICEIDAKTSTRQNDVLTTIHHL